MSISDLVRLDGYKFIETHKHLELGYILIAVEPINEVIQCRRCKSALDSTHGRHRIKAKYLPIFSYDAFIVCWRRKGFWYMVSAPHIP